MLARDRPDRERWPVALEFRRSSHSFSLTDVPLTLALIFASGTHAFLAIFSGTVIALLLRRLPAIKFVFNLAQFALVSCVMIVLVHVAAEADPGFGWLTWGSVLIATQLGGILTIAQILARDRRSPRAMCRASRSARCSAWTSS